VTLLFALVSIAHASDTKLFVDPPSKNVVIDNQFTINVSVADVTDLAGYEFNLTWNSVVLQYIDDEIHLWNGSISDWYINVTQTENSYMIGAMPLWPIPPFNGSTSLVTITYKAIELGQTNLILSNTILGNSTGENIPHDVENGFVKVVEKPVGGISIIKSPLDESMFLNPTIKDEPESWNICIPLALVATATITVNIVRKRQRTMTSTKKKHGNNKIIIFVFGLIICLIIAGFIYLYRPPIPKAGIIDHLSATNPNEQFVNTCTKMLKESGFKVFYHETEEITVDFYRRLPLMGYKIIILRSHSALTKIENETEAKPPVTIFTSEPFNETKYVSEVEAEQLGKVFFTDNDTKQYFGVTPLFIANNTMYNGYKDTIVINMGCDTIVPNVIQINDISIPNLGWMADIFHKRGAILYTGFNGPVSVEYTDKTTISLLKHLLTFRYGLKEAVTKTQEDVGLDPDFGSSLMAGYRIGAEDYVIPCKGG